jgi:hypothetical protein
MNDYPKILNDDGGFKKKILLNNGKNAILVEVNEQTALYNIPCPICGEMNEFRVYNPNGRNDNNYCKNGGNFTGYNNHSCIYCGVYFQPKLR